MIKKKFKVFASTTAALAFVAFATQMANSDQVEVKADAQFAFPALQAGFDDVAKIEMQNANGSITLERQDGIWISPDRYGYRADVEDVNDLLVQMANMFLSSQKTSKPERYSRLEVEDVGEDAKSRSVRLISQSGDVVADAVIGKRVFKLVGDEREGTYIRKADDPTVWLATGGLRVSDQIKEWLDFELVKVARNDIKQIEVMPVDDDRYSIARDTQDDDFKLVNLMPGENQKEDEKFFSMSGALASLSIDDVKPVKDVVFPMKAHTISFETFDGMKINARVAKSDEKHWLIMDGKFVGDEQTSDANPTRENIDRLNEKVSEWAFQINERLYERLTKPKSEWLEETPSTS